MAPKKYSLTKKRPPSNVRLSAQFKKHTYSKYYPSIIDPAFSNKITHHPIFKKYKLTGNTKKLQQLYKAFETNTPLAEDSKKTSSNIWILKPSQKLLRNFMSPYTPYRSLLIYHEMGVGKTCTAITIAESLKNIVKNSNTKIYIIRPDELERQIFNINVVKDNKPLFQCTGDTYLQNPAHSALIENCKTGDETSCEKLKMRVNKDIKQFYEFAGSRLWANKVQNAIDMKTKGITDPVKLAAKIRQVIGKMFDNAVIIVDEAHELRASDDKESKIVPPVMNMVLKNASNLRLIFLTATPIYDKPQNIISLINYFLLNDKRELMKENEVFDKEGNLKQEGSQILIENTRGYISFLRGSNPFEFPIRISAKYNIPNDIITPDKYPKKDIYGRQLKADDKIKYLELVNCPLKKEQLDIFNYHIKYNEIPDIDVDKLDEYDAPLTDDEAPQEIEAINEPEMMKQTKSSNKETIKSSNKETIKENKTTKYTTRKTLKTLKQSRKLTRKQTHKEEPDFEPIKHVAYGFERQLGNFVYQSLEECNNNIKLAVGDLGLSQVASKMQGKYTYQFNDPQYGKRFLLPQLANWGAKIAKVVERAIASNGPVFIYTNFLASGIIPIAFALEMNGFRRYKEHGNPLLENEYKDNNYKGDYIIYTGKTALSLHAEEYLNKGRNMIYEKNVKVFIGTSVASEGLNLFGYKEVHIIDPWHNINLIEQSIGRIIRTGSHLHLPPQERNVVVYQYVATLPDKESFDLKIYKICEDKAVKAASVEKIMKENAFDCELNKEKNVYDNETYSKLIPLITSNNKHIKISLADLEYSRSCFYMKHCDFKCIGSSINEKTNRNTNTNTITNTNTTKSQYDDMPIMKFSFDKDVEEFRNLIMQLMQSHYNIKIDNLKNYIKKLTMGIQDEIADDKTNSKYKIRKSIKSSKYHNESSEQWDDEEAFYQAIQDIVNHETIITDTKFNRRGKIILSGEYLRFVPMDNIIPNMAIQKQYIKPQTTVGDIAEIDLKGFITTLEDQQKKIVEGEVLDYDNILMKNIITKSEEIFYGAYRDFKFNTKIKLEEIVELIFTKLIYQYKFTILKGYIQKIINNGKMSDNEKKLDNVIKKHIVMMKDIFPSSKTETEYAKNIYGFIIQNDNKLELYTISGNKFEKNPGNLKKIIENKKSQLDKTPNSKLYGFLKYEKSGSEPAFKITDIVEKGEKKSVKGITCNTKPTSQIQKNLLTLDDKALKISKPSYTKNTLCNDVEITMKRFDSINKNGKKWYYTPEEYYIYFESDSR